MPKYTTEWAKEYLREHKMSYAIAQDENGEVYTFTKYKKEMKPIDDKNYNVKYWSGNPQTYVGRMLEHPAGS